MSWPQAAEYNMITNKQNNRISGGTDSTLLKLYGRLTNKAKKASYNAFDDGSSSGRSFRVSGPTVVQLVYAST
jgi:hypothetical protein